MSNTLTLHVSQDCSSGWSGLLETSESSSAGSPFSSIHDARDEIRTLRKAGLLKGPVEVLVHAGHYELEEPLIFTEEDMADEKTPVKYRVAGDGEVIITGSRQLREFEPAGNGIYKLDLAQNDMKGNVFKQLFIDGVRQMMSRYPNYDHENPYNGGWLYVEGDVPEDVMSLYKEPKGKRDRFICRDPRLKNWKNLNTSEVFIFPRFNWVNNIIRIQSYDPESGEITLSSPATYEICAGDRFYFRNVLEELDMPGEWYLDQGQGILYFYPPHDLLGAVVSVPVIENIITIDGTRRQYESYNTMLESQGQELFNAQNPDTVQKGYITFAGFTIEGCDGVGVLIRNARGIRIEGCTIRNTGLYGIRILGGANCGICDCDIYETGSSGILIKGGLRDEHEECYKSAEHSAINNYIHHTGVFEKCSAGIVLDGTGNTAANNLIHDSPRWGVLGVGNDHLIELNHIRHVNLETSDTGAIYFCNRNFKMKGNQIRFNLIHDIFGHHLLGGKWLPPVITYGIYLDDYTSFAEVYGNITCRTPKGGIFIHDGQENTIENNMFMETALEMVTLLRTKPEVEARKMGVYGQGVRRNVIKRNILSSSRKDAVVYFLDTLQDEEGKIDLDTNLCENNLIWCYENPVMVETHFYSKKISWEQWLKLGYEKSSRVADPLFINPNTDDFTLDENSPVFEMGFEKIPFEKIGLYPSKNWRAWPVVEAEGIREHPSDMENPGEKI